MRRFILIDHSIVGGGGHFLEYARRVLEAAAALGYAPILATNRRFVGAPDLPWPVQAVYPDPFDARLDRASLATPLRWLRPGPSPTPGSRLRALVRPFAGALVDLGECWRRRLRAASFGRATRALLRRLDPKSADMIFVPTLGGPELEALSTTLGELPAAARPAWHLLFRRDVHDGPEARGIVGPRPVAPLRESFRRLLTAAASARIHLHTDTEPLARQYRELLAGLDADVDVCPIPVASDFAAGPPAPSLAAHGVYLGDARMEKGFHHLPDLVAALADPIADGRLRFTFQCYLPARPEPPVRSACDRLEGIAGDAVRLVRHELTSTQYRDLLHAADFVLIPYDPACYRARSSGIFVEAMVAGRPAVVPAGTWMAACLDDLTRGEGGAAGVCYAEPQGIAGAVRELLGDPERFRCGARRAAASWGPAHSPAALVRHIVAGEDPAADMSGDQA